MASPSNPLNPTFEGHIASTLDALLLFEACLNGHLNHVPRRPHDRERQDLIKSGNVFIYEEHASGIKRWTDGVSWSPSRILGNFLIYRELEKPFPPGEKKRALKKSKKCQQGVNKPETTPPRTGMAFPSAMDPNGAGKDTERALIGSLIDSYPFKNEGLVKKTISITFQGVPHHLVSYYNVDDVMSGRLTSPTKHPNLRGIVPRGELIMSQNFRAPIDEVEYGDDGRGGPPGMYAALAGAHEFMTQGGVLHRAMSLPSFQGQQISPYGAPSAPYPFSAPPQATFMGNVPTTTSAPMAYIPTSQGNYALDPTRTTRFGSNAGMVQEYPRNMPTGSPPRRHSATFEAQAPSSDLTGMSLGSIPEGRSLAGGNPYMNASQFYMPGRSGGEMGGQQHTFPSPPRQVKTDSDHLGGTGGADGGPHNYALDTNATTWEFEPLDAGQDQQYFGGHSAGGSQPWSSDANALGRT